MIKATIFNEYRHEHTDPAVREIYPQGIHSALADALAADGEVSVRTATLDEEQHGLTDDVLRDTDVLLWWGHMAHEEVQDEIVDRVAQRVGQGMGLIVLHSGHYSKIFKRLMGTGCGLTWREANERERLWVVNPAHPIAAGLGASIEIPAAETYGEFFDVPDPDELIFVSWFQGGEVFRSGMTWRRGRGRIFYFRPGHETHPIYFQPEVQRVLQNAVRWAGFQGNTAARGIGEAPNVPQAPESKSAK